MKSYASTQPTNQSPHQQQFSSLPTFVSQHQVPPQLPKKTRPKQQAVIRPISCGGAVHAPLNIDMHSGRHNKRKSAVELLAESKPYYVKSETVLDTKQQLLLQSGRSSMKRNSAGMSSAACLISPSHTFPHQRSNTLNSRRSNSTNSELLQMKLRCLIDGSQSSPKETAFDAYASHTNSRPNSTYYRKPSFSLNDPKFEPPKQFRQSPPPRHYTQEVSVRSAFVDFREFVLFHSENFFYMYYAC